ncbi:D-amino-acid oxidase [Mycena latifolia]|nr:D-amino-acid oxidase [Mycena latifolia]
MEKLNVFVVGAGVIGLTTAIQALEAGYNVTLFAEIFPSDPKSIKYTSCWAGANHRSFVGYGPQMHRSSLCSECYISSIMNLSELERETMQVFLDLIDKDPLVPVMTRPQFEFTQTDGQDEIKHFSQFYSDFHSINASELPEGVADGGKFTTICMDVPNYLPYLMERFFQAGGLAFRITVSSLSSLISVKDRPAFEAFPPTSTGSPPFSEPAAVINCTGLGALSLGDVLDTDVYPTRGETILIRAPWVDHSMTYFFKNGDYSYIIPRKSGDIILGGTFQVNDWHPTSRPESVKSMKERGIFICPELLPEGKRDNPNIDDLDVVEECVGLRTTRKGGVRLETTSLVVDGKTYPIVHNYGHGGAGFQSSWGSANRTIELLKAALEERRDGSYALSLDIRIGLIH